MVDRRPASTLVLVWMVAACTYDYDEFRVVDGSSTSSTAATGSASTSSAGGAGASGGSGGATCGGNLKSCAGECVGLDDPAFGCSATQCAPCDVPNATATCAAQACAIDACDAGHDDCDGEASSGCEVDLTGDADHCGACDAACPAGFVCSASACECDENDDCAAGGNNFTCVTSGADLGKCKCVNTVCGVGERCLPGNTCG